MAILDTLKKIGAAAISRVPATKQPVIPSIPAPNATPTPSMGTAAKPPLTISPPSSSPSFMVQPMPSFQSSGSTTSVIPPLSAPTNVPISRPVAPTLTNATSSPQSPQAPFIPTPAPSYSAPPAPQAPSGGIPFKAGLSDAQKTSISALAGKPIAQWSDTDRKNWSYATNNAPIPTTSAAPSRPVAPQIPTTPSVPVPAPTNSSIGDNQQPQTSPVAPILTDAQKAQSAAAATYQSNLALTPEEMATQQELDRLNESARKAYTATGDQTIPLEFITGQQKSIEQRALDLAEPLNAKAARLQAQRIASLNASKFALDRADQAVSDEKAAKAEAKKAENPIEVGGNLVKYNPTTGKYEAVYSTPDKPAEGFTLSEGQRRYDAKGNLVASGGEKQDSPGNYEVVQDQKTGAFFRVNKLTGQAEPIMQGGGVGGPSSNGGSLGQGSISYRTNNPGNIKWSDFARSMGAVDSGIKASDGGTFALFPSVESGTQAQLSLLRSPSYANLTLDAAMRRWSNNGYGADVVGGSIDPNRTIASLNPQEMGLLQQAMQKREGYSAPQQFSTTPKDSNGATSEEKKARAQQIKDVATTLLNGNLNAAVGPIDSRFPTLLPSTADFEANANRLKSLLTLENLGLLKGAMSDKDLEVLSSASAALSPNMSQEGYRKELERIIKVADGALGSNLSQSTSSYDANSLRAQYNY